jgi:hypothetical protein
MSTIINCQESLPGAVGLNIASKLLFEWPFESGNYPQLLTLELENKPRLIFLAVYTTGVGNLFEIPSELAKILLLYL